MVSLNFLMLFLVLTVIPLSLCGLSTKHVLLSQSLHIGCYYEYCAFSNIFLLPLCESEVELEA